MSDINEIVGNYRYVGKVGKDELHNKTRLQYVPSLIIKRKNYISFQIYERYDSTFGQVVIENPIRFDLILYSDNCENLDPYFHVGNIVSILLNRYGNMSQDKAALLCSLTSRNLPPFVEQGHMVHSLVLEF